MIPATKLDKALKMPGAPGPSYLAAAPGLLLLRGMVQIFHDGPAVIASLRGAFFAIPL
jgi:hypothetical protein